MSAINPASFASPTLGIQAPSGVGPGAVGVGRSASTNERRQNQQQQQQQQQQEQQSAFAQGGQGGRGLRQGLGQQFGAERNPYPAQAYPPPAYGYAGAFGNPRAGNYGAAVSTAMDGFAGATFQQYGDFQAMRNRYPTPQSIPSPNPHSQGASPLSSQNDWAAAIQGLSLNSH
jgi:hypothetical protein